MGPRADCSSPLKVRSAHFPRLEGSVAQWLESPDALARLARGRLPEYSYFSRFFCCCLPSPALHPSSSLIMIFLCYFSPLFRFRSST